MYLYQSLFQHQCIMRKNGEDKEMTMWEAMKSGLESHFLIIIIFTNWYWLGCQLSPNTHPKEVCRSAFIMIWVATAIWFCLLTIFFYEIRSEGSRFEIFIVGNIVSIIKLHYLKKTTERSCFIILEDGKPGCQGWEICSREKIKTFLHEKNKRLGSKTELSSHRKVWRLKSRPLSRICCLKSPSLRKIQLWLCWLA